MKIEWAVKKTCTFCILAILALLVPIFIVASSVPEYQSAAQMAASQEDITYFKNILGGNYNYTELIQWENQHITFSRDSDMQRNTDPIEILAYGKGRCMEFAILYAALCICQGYRCRMVESPLTDHAWTEIEINGSWIHVDSSLTLADIRCVNDPLMYERDWHRPPIIALAFEGSSIVEVTSTYRSDHRSIVSPSTIDVGIVTVWFFFCVCLVWSNRRILLRKAGRRAQAMEHFLPSTQPLIRALGWNTEDTVRIRRLKSLLSPIDDCIWHIGLKNARK